MANADQWPPSPFHIAGARYNEHRAWWAGDMATIKAIYSGTGVATHVHKGVAHRGGVIGGLSKMFWGQPVAEGENRTQLHLPLPADVAQKSSSLLFGEAPRIELPDFEEKNKSGQARLDLIMRSDESHSQLLIAGEYASALGGAYLAPVWDTDVADHVFPKAYRADVAIPTFRHGRLSSVKLWTEYRTDNANIIFRLIEEHTAGLIRYTLHKGSENVLGQAVPITEHTETAHLSSLISPVEYLALATDGKYTVSVATGISEMAVSYIPNMLPNPDWEQFGPLASVGRSDFLGNEPVFDKVDQMWSSLFRDVDNGQGRLTVPESYLETSGVGKGATFDVYRQVYSGINALGSAGDSLASQITQTQFDIRDETHLNIIDALERRVLRTIGLSPKEFGKVQPSGSKTATEVNDDRSESEATRDVKGIHARPALAKLARLSLAIDGVVFPGKGGGEFGIPEVTFAKISQEDPEKRARTLQILDMARAISLEARVRERVRDDNLTDTEIKEEIARVQLEQGKPAPDPATFTGEPGKNEELAP